MRRIRVVLLALGVLVLALANLPPAAAAGQSDFAVQVSPSPLVATLKPGKTSTLDLQVRNTGDRAQALKMGLRSFTVGSDGKVTLGKTPPADVAQFVSFSQPTFTLIPGQFITQHVVVNTPASAGFTYSFAVTVSGARPAKGSQGKTALQGSVADFTLLSVDRPGATRKLAIDQLLVTRHVYEYLPATITLRLKNLGNTLVQPEGNIFIQRGSSDNTPLATIKLNPDNGYILPGSSRVLSDTWESGFPHYITVNTGGESKRQLSWQGSDFSKIRFGHYTAKVVAVYNDGQRDVPLTAEVTFWVIPWRLLLAVILIVVLCVVGAFTTLRRSTRLVPRHKKPSSDKKDEA